MTRGNRLSAHWFIVGGPGLCLRSTTTHLRPGGQLFVEAFRPDPARFDAQGWRVEDRSNPGGGHHFVRSTHDAAARTVRTTYELDDGDYQVVLHYRTPTELDTLAAQAGFHLVHRWHDWSGRPAREASTDPVSVYVLEAP